MNLFLGFPDGTFAPAVLSPIINSDGTITVEAVQDGDPFNPSEASVSYDTDYTVAPGLLDSTLALLPTVLDHDVTLHLSPGNYEAIVATRFIGPGRLRFEGPATITGTATDTVRGQAFTAGILVSGQVRCELVNLTVAASAGHGVWLHSGARVLVQDVSVTGSTAKAFAVWDGASVELAGTVAGSGFTSRGMQVGFGSRATFAAAGSLTLTGNNAAWGLHCVDHGQFAVHAQQAFTVTFTMQSCAIAYQCGLDSLFTLQSPGGMFRALNCGKVAQVTDCSSISTNQSFAFTGTPVEVASGDVNSRSHYERPGLVIDG